jgi:hypothetical protein
MSRSPVVPVAAVMMMPMMAPMMVVPVVAAVMVMPVVGPVVPAPMVMVMPPVPATPVMMVVPVLHALDQPVLGDRSGGSGSWSRRGGTAQSQA